MRFSDILPGLGGRIFFASTERSQIGGEQVEAQAAPAKPASIYECPNFQLNHVREKLANVDQSIARILVDFRQAAEPVKRPDSKLLSRVKLPKDIEQMAIDSNTPRELFTGVLQFLAVTVKDDGRIISERYNRDLTAQFKNLCEELVERHRLSYKVYDYQKLTSGKSVNGMMTIMWSHLNRSNIKMLSIVCTSFVQIAVLTAIWEG